MPLNKPKQLNTINTTYKS